MKELKLYCLSFLLLGVPLVTYGQSWSAIFNSNESEVCLGDSVAAYIYINGGVSPWDVVITDNFDDSIVLENIVSPKTVWLKPQENNTYTIVSVIDASGNKGKVDGSVALIVHLPTPVTINMDRTVYRVSEPGIDLISSPMGAYFYGVGVSGNRFYPAVAGYENSPHNITCLYTNAFGCVSSDAADFYVLSGASSVVIESGGVTVNALCDDGATYVIRGSNADGIPGTFTLVEGETSTPVPGHISDGDLNDDEALLNPAGLSGAYDIVYSYSLEQVTIDATFHFLVNDLGEIGITGLPDTVCKNSDPYLLVPDLFENDPTATYLFSGSGVSGNMSEGYYFDPSDPGVPLGETAIGIEYTSSNGCKTTTSKIIYCSFVPTVSFLLSSVCIPSDGGIVDFTNMTSGKFSVAGWSWDFDDPESGTNNFSSLENPQHFYSEPNFRSISLTATTYDGCVASYSRDTVLVDQPDVDFTLISDCFVRGEMTRLLNRTVSSLADIDTLVWTFRTSSGGVLGVIGSGSPEDTITFPFTSMDRYQVSLQVENAAGCGASLTREIVLRPVKPVPATGYLENFNSGTGDWVVMSKDQNQSWVLDIPDFEGFTQVPGDLAWYTELPVYSTGYVEESWVQSPCYDISNLSAPLIQLDLMKSFAPGTDGAVLQYQDYVSEGWKTVGYVGEGINWYNEQGIYNEPGGENFGWGLALFEPDNRWVNAGHAVDRTSDFPYGKFRVIIASGGTQAMGNQGFAFDNFYVGERLRHSILEYFTNTTSVTASAADDVVDAFGSGHAGNVTDLQYHTDFPGEDPMNVNNPVPASARIFNVGVPSVPYAVLNGGLNEDKRFTFQDPSEEPTADVLGEETLEVPKFDVMLHADFLEARVDFEVRVTCTADTFAPNLQLYIAVIEREVTAYTGVNQDTSFRNVVLDMLPDPTGLLLGNAWYSGKEQILEDSWDYPVFIEDVEDLALVAFVQNRANGEVLQADVVPFSYPLGVLPQIRSFPSLNLFPNPAGESVFVHFGQPVERKGVLEITDISGKMVHRYEVEPGYTLQKLDISHLTEGLYMVFWKESGMVRARSRMVKLR